jgi:two-component sensor histidine kinase/ActR/RegA family two-component response regulator
MNRKKERILIVEDDLVDQLAFDRFARAEKFPYDYLFASSVKEASEILDREKFDVVLLDYKLGDGTAFDLFETVKGTPFIIVTGTGHEEIAVKAMKAGAYDYLTKDMEGNYLKVLPITVENALKQKQAEDELLSYRMHLEELVKARTVELQLEVAERKKAEEALKEAHAKLEKRVEERTAELRKTNQELRKEIDERKRAETRLSESLKEKEVLLKEIHHRVKNNMQIISSLLRLQSRAIKDKAVRDMFEVSQSRIRSMALIHEKLYQSESLSRIDFSDYVKNLITYLFSIYQVSSMAVKRTLDLEEHFLDINKAIPLALIINEIVSNSLKHAFPDERKGEIYVKMKCDEQGKRIICVGDNGVGLPDNFDIGNTETLGMRLISDLVTQVNGSIKINKKNGVMFEISF